MSELLVFDKDMWETISNMLQSQDKESRELAFGMLQTIDYNSKDQMDVFEENMHTAIASSIPSEDKGKLIHHYFLALSKQNGNIK